MHATGHGLNEFFFRGIAAKSFLDEELRGFYSRLEAGMYEKD